ncbi:MAG TPA: MmgE/PrpD family protein [Steroidobacteraceae bacterium]
MIRSNEDLAQRIARWASDFQPSQRQVERIRASIRDFFGCVVAGVTQEELGPALRICASGSVSVWGLAETFDAPGAALVTGTAGSLWQLHDIYLPAGLHPSSPVISAAWASWNNARRPSRSFVQAVAAGYEACNRIGLACWPAQAIGGSSSTATAGAIGASVAAGLISGLNADGIARAISNAALLLPAAPTACMRAHGALVPLHGGLAARAATEAALLAQDTGSGRRVLEGDDVTPGLITFLRGDVGAITPESWNGDTLNRIGWKFFPACFGCHTALEAVLRILPTNVHGIARIVVRVPERLFWLIEPGIGKESLYDRLMSLRWVIARALERRAFGWTDAIANSASTHLLAEKVDVVHEATLDDLPDNVMSADIELHMNEGVSRIQYRRPLYGEPYESGPRGWTSDLDDDALTQKFTILTKGSKSFADELTVLMR